MIVKDGVATPENEEDARSIRTFVERCMDPSLEVDGLVPGWAQEAYTQAAKAAVLQHGPEANTVHVRTRVLLHAMLAIDTYRQKLAAEAAHAAVQS